MKGLNLIHILKDLNLNQKKKVLDLIQIEDKELKFRFKSWESRLSV